MKLPGNMKYMSVAIITVYVIMMLYALFTLFNLPEKVLDAVGMSDYNQMEKAKMVSYYAFFVVMITFIAGFFVSSIFLAQSRVESIIYVEKDEKREQVSEVESEQNIDDKALNKLAALQKQIAKNSPDLKEKSTILLNSIAKDIEICVGVVYMAKYESGNRYLEFLAGYAFQLPDSKPIRLEFGEGIVGQVAKEGKPISVTSVPEGYITVFSGLGQSTPQNLMVFPVKVKGKVLAMLEIASFQAFDQFAKTYLQYVTDYFAEQLADPADLQLSQDTENTID